MAFRCCRAEEKSVPKLKKSIYNFSALTKDDAAALIKEITSDVIPDILKPLDPEDDTFAKARDVQDLPRVKAPPTLIGSLLPFQEKGLGWMLAQEQSEIKGGILADQVGGQPGGEPEPAD
jgi:DNA repair protein RAD16